MSAVLFQNMPPLSPEEYAALEASIREHGVQVPILVDDNRVVIDGHHRQKIAAELNVECPKRFAGDLSDTEKRTLALTLNLDRRHLSRDQRRELVAASVKSDPQLSNRQHAERTGVSPTTAGAVRDELERAGDVSKMDTRTDSVGRQQPGAKAKSTAEVPQSKTRVSADGRTRPSTQPERPAMPPFDPDTGEVLSDEPAPEPEQKSRPEPRKPQRRALIDGLRPTWQELHDRSLELSAALEDDRFRTNRDQITDSMGGPLMDVVAHVSRFLGALNPDQFRGTEQGLRERAEALLTASETCQRLAEQLLEESK